MIVEVGLGSQARSFDRFALTSGRVVKDRTAVRILAAVVLVRKVLVPRDLRERKSQQVLQLAEKTELDSPARRSDGTSRCGSWSTSSCCSRPACMSDLALWAILDERGRHRLLDAVDGCERTFLGDFVASLRDVVLLRDSQVVPSQSGSRGGREGRLRRTSLHWRQETLRHSARMQRKSFSILLSMKQA